MDHRELYRGQEYKPGNRFTTIFWMFVVLIISSGILISVNSGYSGALDDVHWTWFWAWFAATMIGALAGPLLIEYATLRSSGARLTRKPWSASNRVPYLFRWWYPEDQGLTKWQFVTATGVPALFMWVVLILYAIGNPMAAGAIGFALVNVVGNFWYSALVLAKPGGTLIEEFDGGLRFRLPAGSGVPNSPGRSV